MSRYLLGYCAAAILTSVVFVATGVEDPIPLAYLTVGAIGGLLFGAREGYRYGRTAGTAEASATRARRDHQRARATRPAREDAANGER